MAYWHWTLGNTKVQNKISDFGKTTPLPMPGHGFLFRHPLGKRKKKHMIFITFQIDCNYL